MYIKKNFGIKSILVFSGGHLIWLTLWVTLVVSVVKFTGWEWLSIPWLPLSLIGTAVAFYVGFKNNSAYDRLWEARKIWGAIVNSSRSWGSNIRGYVSNQFTNSDDATLKAVQERLIYRHIAWLYTLRSQLLVSTPWEHIRQGKIMEKHIKGQIKKFGVGLYSDAITEKELRELLPENELERLINSKNTATQIIDQQSQDLKEARSNNLIDDFRHMELQKILNDFYTFQGQCERIKKFPLPRQYGSMSFVFIAIFIFLLPFGMASEFNSFGEYGIWLSIPFTILVAWVFLMMELVGDYSENPFEGLGNDIPMLSLCRTIEIDLREMLGETNLPLTIEAKNGVLM
ncbi:bestrophin family ion channel [Aquimarina addita]|uniref:Bestrophin family ion channel n=1 Tax=Aquimarina addita TaxID=870485 RepID=A0ABP6UPD7_9FLAO